MNISYVDFWPGFDSNCNWFNLVFKELFNDREINFNSKPEESDILMFSCFGNSHQKYKGTKAVKIFYTGENQRPDLSFADFSLSFDYDSHNGKNFRLPHWYMYVNWWGQPNFPHARISKQQLFHEYLPEEIAAREKFCCIIIGNPVANRIEVAQKLNDIEPVYGYGRVFGNFYDGCKVDLLRNFRYNICFENSIYPGYVTEKLLEAKVAGCIPIYYGSKTVNQDFNEKCFINFLDYKNSDELKDKIIEIESDSRKFIEIAREKLFKINPSLDNLYLFMKHALKI